MFFLPLKLFDFKHISYLQAEPKEQKIFPCGFSKAFFNRNLVLFHSNPQEIHRSNIESQLPKQKSRHSVSE
jgi:hypothetical protein